MTEKKFCDIVTVFNGHGQLTSNTEAEVRYPRCQEVSSEESWAETVTVSLINVACWFVLNQDFSCSLFCQAALSRLSISFSRCTHTEVLKGISTNHHHCSHHHYRFAPKGLAFRRGSKHTFAQSCKDKIPLFLQSLLPSA